MPMLSRRTLLPTLLATTALAGCNGVALTPAQIVTDVGTLAKGLSGALTALVAAAPSLIPATTVTTLQNDLTLAQGAASSLSSTLPAANGADIAQRVDGYINAVLNTLAAPPINGLIPAPFNLAIAGAALLVPEIEQFVNQYLPTASASLAMASARASLMAKAPGMMTLDAARAELGKYKH